MQYPAKTIDSVSVQRATDHGTSYAQELTVKCLAYAADADKKARLKQAVCRYHYYISVDRIGGSAMTDQPCGLCGVIMHFGSTATDAICSDCATKHSLCKQCGADLHDRKRRVFNGNS